jgi:glycosyltransferase involved in cell wall biosynthesis
MANPLLSLIIPTRERARTLVSALATALDQHSEDYEVIVSDNASQDDTRTVVERSADDRVRYLNTGTRLSMCDNWEFALEQARGDYVLIIGDDDAVMPGQLDALLARLKTFAEPTIHMWPLHFYDWPTEDCAGRLAYLAPVIPEAELYLKQVARDAFRLGTWKYYRLPSPYHSAVPRQILALIRRQTGRVFHSTQPDIFTAMAIPQFADRAINIGTAVTVNGHSSQSNGCFVRERAIANVARFVGEYGEYRFHHTLVHDMAASANGIPDAALVARDLFPGLYENVEFGYSAMWAFICRLGWMSHGEVLRRSRELRRSHNFSVIAFSGYAALHQLAAVRRRMLHAVDTMAVHKDRIPDNIGDFVKALAGDSRLRRGMTP